MRSLSLPALLLLTCLIAPAHAIIGSSRVNTKVFDHVPSPSWQTLSNGSSSHDNEEAAANNITGLLDSLLLGYDQKLRPLDPHGGATRVFIDISVRSMGPISEMDGSYALDCYFRQAWFDTRLSFTSVKHSKLSLGMSMLDKIWRPDTYFWNGHKSYLHRLTQPNRLVRLQANGMILYSSRLTIIAKCNMDLVHYPADIQRCSLTIGSFGHHEHEMVYRWKKGLTKSVLISGGDQSMSQFEVSTRLHPTRVVPYRDGEYSTLTVDFILTRHTGYFVINFYIPCSLVLFMSWVAFWINREATADRISLVVTSILTMTFFSQDARSDIPKVSYPTALDVYILICFLFLFLNMIEFCVVHMFTKFGTGDPEMTRLERARVQALIQTSLPRNACFRRPVRTRLGRRDSLANRLSVAAELDDDSDDSQPEGDDQVLSHLLNHQQLQRPSNAASTASKPPAPFVSLAACTPSGFYTQRRHAFMAVDDDHNNQHNKPIARHIRWGDGGSSKPRRRPSTSVTWATSVRAIGQAQASSVCRAYTRFVDMLEHQFMLANHEKVNSISFVDRICRFLFPALYIVCMFVYWVVYWSQTL